MLNLKHWYIPLPKKKKTICWQVCIPIEISCIKVPIQLRWLYRTDENPYVRWFFSPLNIAIYLREIPERRRKPRLNKYLQKKTAMFNRKKKTLNIAIS